VDTEQVLLAVALTLAKAALLQFTELTEGLNVSVSYRLGCTAGAMYVLLLLSLTALIFSIFEGYLRLEGWTLHLLHRE
jgi:hypothetical protein